MPTWSQNSEYFKMYMVKCALPKLYSEIQFKIGNATLFMSYFWINVAFLGKDKRPLLSYNRALRDFCNQQQNSVNHDSAAILNRQEHLSKQVLIHFGWSQFIQSILNYWEEHNLWQHKIVESLRNLMRIWSLKRFHRRLLSLLYNYYDKLTGLTGFQWICGKVY